MIGLMILAAGLTPAWQQIMVLDQLRQGQVNRARTVHWCASGKVLNVGLALHQLGAPGKTLSLLGGFTGEAIRAAFKDLPARWVDSPVPTRVCTTLLDEASGQTTELVENAAALGEREIESFLAAFKEEAQAATLTVLTGSLPAGAPSNLYRRALECFSAKAILDVRGPELLEALRCQPFLVKPNREELAGTLGVSELKEKGLVEAMHQLNTQGADWVVVTQGAQPVLVTHAGQCHSLTPPLVKGVVNPIGCGDCLAAGIADAFLKSDDVLQAIRWGMACAADNLGQLLPAQIDRTRARGHYLAP